MEHQVDRDMPVTGEGGASVPPFTMEFVLTVTRTKVLRAIRYAVRKTHRRLRDFPEGDEKYKEVLDTIDELDDCYRKILAIFNEKLWGSEDVTAAGSSTGKDQSGDR